MVGIDFLLTFRTCSGNIELHNIQYPYLHIRISIYMSSRRTILLKDLGEKDKKIFMSILPVISSKLNQEWAVVSSGEADITVVDADKKDGRVIATECELLGKVVIRISQNTKRSNTGVWLRKPIRSVGILNCVIKLDDTHYFTKKNAKLHRWPKKEIIQSCLGSSRLCAIFMRKALSVERASELSGISYSKVLEFVSSCIETNCMDLIPVDSSSFLEHKKNKNYLNSNLFSKLRLKIYGRK